MVAQLGERDRRILAKFRKDEAIPQAEWEAGVGNAVAVALEKFIANDFAGAGRALGQVAENEVFVVSPAKGGIARVRWLMAVLFCVFDFEFTGHSFARVPRSIGKTEWLVSGEPD